jgi:hypothetical protein
MRPPGIDIGRAKTAHCMVEEASSRYASIANCKTRREAPVAATAKNPCATRVIKFVLFMCAYPLTDRTDDTMRRPPSHNKRTI